MNATLRPALVLFGALSVLVGVLYPLAVTGIGTLVFAGQAGGSLVLRDARPIGSSLIGQSFSSPGYFWGRPSATAPMSNNAGASSGSNQGPLNPAYIAAVQARIAALREAEPANRTPVPVDLVTTSASGLDPDISVAAARFQSGRIAAARKLARAQVERLIEANTSRQQLGFLGENRVNVLALNLALDAAAPLRK